jgi:hypothetical protein
LKSILLTLIFAATAHAQIILDPMNGDPCDAENGQTAKFCIMIGAPLAGTIVSPFVNHRSCGITDNAVVVVRIKQLEDGSLKRIKEVTAVPSEESQIGGVVAAQSVSGIQIPTFPNDHNPMENYWIVTDLDDNRPLPGKRILLKTVSSHEPDPNADDSRDSQFLIHMLDENCGSFDPQSNLDF